jgi:hypothetical protein
MLPGQNLCSARDQRDAVVELFHNSHVNNLMSWHSGCGLKSSPQSVVMIDDTANKYTDTGRLKYHSHKN